MPRAIWSGSISFGLVNVPVRLHTATEEKDISFHQFDEKSGKRIRMKRVREDNGREVEYRNIVKGYETSKGKYVMVTPEELASVDPGRTKTIDIEDFVARWGGAYEHMLVLDADSLMTAKAIVALVPTSTNGGAIVTCARATPAPASPALAVTTTSPSHRGR